MGKQGNNGLLALLGIGAGVFAWWKYKNMSPDKKKELHAKVNNVGQKVQNTVLDVETAVKEQYNHLKNNIDKNIDRKVEDLN